MDLRRWALLSLPFALAGCGNLEASIRDLNPPAVSIARESVANAAVTSSQNVETPENRYIVQASTGALTDKIVLRSPNGSLVYTSTQGSLFDDETTRELQESAAVIPQ